MDRIEVGGMIYEFEDGISLMAILDENADRVYEGAASETPNAPLTPDELREMGSDWVWIASLIPNYVVVTGYYIKYPDFSYSDGILIGYLGHMSRYLKYAQYGRAWLAYRRKPEGGTV